MKLKRTPLILLAIATLFGLGVYLHESQQASQQQASQNQGQPLFTFKEEDVQAFTLKTPQHTLAFTRRAASPAPKKSSPPSPGSTADAPVWQMTNPKTTAASNASVAYLLNLLATAKREKTLTVPTAKQAELGFDHPLAIVDVTLKDQKTHRLVLGNPDFNRSYLYAQVDPPEKPQPELSVSLVTMDFENAVKRPVPEWEGQPKIGSQN
ncbi:MAG: DUF4340 domain-containing protein [Leptolyngbyaceae cyanobacterium]